MKRIIIVLTLLICITGVFAFGQLDNGGAWITGDLGSLDNANATWFENLEGYLSIKLSAFTSLFAPISEPLAYNGTLARSSDFFNSSQSDARYIQNDTAVQFNSAKIGNVTLEETDAGGLMFVVG